MRILVNPNSVFIIIWVSLVALFSLGVLKINVPYSWGALFIVSVNVILALALFLITLIKRNVFDQAALRVFLGASRAVVDKYVRLLFFVYVLISVLDVIYSGGIPFIWKMVGDTKQYVDFGIPTLHGIANSIIYFLSALCVILYCLKVGSHRVILLTIFVWQFLIFSRGTIMVMIVQMVGVYMFLAPSSIKRTFFVCLLALAVILFFGVTGDLRQGENPYYGLLVPEWESFFSIVPSGFLWVYVYLVSGFNNLLFNASLIEPTYLPVYTFAKMVPSVVYNLLGIEKAVDSFEFVNAGLNVSTIYSGFYSDFGLFAFVPVFIIQLMATVTYMRALGGSVYDLLAFSVCYQAIVFSPFIDTFFYLPFIAQFLIVLHFKKVIEHERT